MYLSYILIFSFIKQVRQHGKTRKKLTGMEAKNMKLANMVVAIVMFFLLCNIVRVVFIGLSYHGTNNYVELTPLWILAIDINSSVNYIIYCLFGKKFRQAFISLFSACTFSRRASIS